MLELNARVIFNLLILTEFWLLSPKAFSQQYLFFVGGICSLQKIICLKKWTINIQ